MSSNSRRITMRRDQHVYILEEMSIMHKEYGAADVTLSWMTAMEWACSGGTILINDLAYSSRRWRTIKLYPRLTTTER